MKCSYLKTVLSVFAFYNEVKYNLIFFPVGALSIPDFWVYLNYATFWPKDGSEETASWEACWVLKSKILARWKTIPSCKKYVLIGGWGKVTPKQKPEKRRCLNISVSEYKIPGFVLYNLDNVNFLASVSIEGLRSKYRAFIRKGKLENKGVQEYRI